LGLKHWGEKSCAPTLGFLAPGWRRATSFAEPSGWHRLAVVQARLRRGRVDTGGLDMLRAWDPKFLPFWVWNHQHHQLEACDLDSGAHLELWFVPVGPLCCVQSMLWISIPSWRAYKIHGILLIFFLCSSLPRGEVWCPLEWRKTGHQELQGLLWSLLAFLGMFKTFKTWISKHHLLKQLHLMIMVRPFSNKVASWAYSYIMLYQLYSP
jgi:hypothetical protein